MNKQGEWVEIEEKGLKKKKGGGISFIPYLRAYGLSKKRERKIKEEALGLRRNGSEKWLKGKRGIELKQQKMKKMKKVKVKERIGEKSESGRGS